MIGNDVLQSCSLYFVQTLSKMTTTLKLSRPDETLTTYKYILFWLVKLVIADPHLMLHVSCHPLMPVHQIICHVNSNYIAWLPVAEGLVSIIIILSLHTTFGEHKYF